MNTELEHHFVSHLKEAFNIELELYPHHMGVTWNDRKYFCVKESIHGLEAYTTIFYNRDAETLEDVFSGMHYSNGENTSEGDHLLHSSIESMLCILLEKRLEVQGIQYKEYKHDYIVIIVFRNGSVAPYSYTDRRMSDSGWSTMSTIPYKFLQEMIMDYRIANGQEIQETDNIVYIDKESNSDYDDYNPVGFIDGVRDVVVVPPSVRLYSKIEYYRLDRNNNKIYCYTLTPMDLYAKHSSAHCKVECIEFYRNERMEIHYNTHLVDFADDITTSICRKSSFCDSPLFTKEESQWMDAIEMLEDRPQFEGLRFYVDAYRGFYIKMMGVWIPTTDQLIKSIDYMGLEQELIDEIRLWLSMQ